MLKNVFKITVIIEKFNGSLEFSFAKKIGVRIFTKIKAIRPKEKTFRAIEELWVEIASNAPLSNKKEIINSGNTYNATEAGIARSIEYTIVFSIVLLILDFLFSLICFDILGSRTIPIAIPMRARGSW